METETEKEIVFEALRCSATPGRSSLFELTGIVTDRAVR